MSTTRFIPSQVWKGSERTRQGFTRLGDAHNAARKDGKTRGKDMGPGWSGLYEFTMINGRWFWREKLPSTPTQKGE